VFKKFIYDPSYQYLNQNINSSSVEEEKLGSDKSIKILKKNYEKIKFEIFKELKITFSNFIHLVILDLIFILFVILNKFSIVLGDKTSHSLVIHLAQINHLLIFSLFFFPCLNFYNVIFFYDILKNFSFNRRINKKQLISYFLIFFSLIFLLMFFDKYSYVHEYILSDNRHYSFYYFKRIYINELLRYMILFYVSFTYSNIIFENMNFLKDSLFIAWVICTFLAIVPAKLFEFRYLTPCYITLLLIIHTFLEPSIKLKKCLYNIYNVYWSVIINVITIYVFIFKPWMQNAFSKDYSRFMW